MLIQRARHDQRGTSAVEFALWLPVLSLMLLGGVDVTRYEIATGRISTAASTIGQMLAVNTSGNVNYVDLQFYIDSAMIIYPQILADAKGRGISWSSELAVTISHIKFTASPNGCTSACTYTPKVVWTAGSNKRSCYVTATASSDSSIPSATTLPSDAFGPTSLIAVDVVFTFRPTLGSSFLPSSTISRSYFVNPRYVTSIAYQTIAGDPGTTTVCP